MYSTRQFTGSEHLHLGGSELPYDMLRFWQLSLSDILLNMNRGTFAEYIVRCALSDGGFDSLKQGNGSLRPFDITGPEIPSKSRPSRIEVKSAASIQSTTPDSAEPLTLPDSKIIFGIQPAIDWNSEDHTARRNNDLYVFCHYTATRKMDDMLDLTFWEFYILPTSVIENDAVLVNQKTISLYRLKKIGLKSHSFIELYEEIMSAISKI